MIVTCEVCEVVYNDEDRFTYCPHDYLAGNYCRQHDLFACPFHEAKP